MTTQSNSSSRDCWQVVVKSDTRLEQLQKDFEEKKAAAHKALDDLNKHVEALSREGLAQLEDYLKKQHPSARLTVEALISRGSYPFLCPDDLGIRILLSSSVPLKDLQQLSFVDKVTGAIVGGPIF